MFITLLTFLCLPPDFWLPDAEFDRRHLGDRLAGVRKHEGRAARAASELDRVDPASPEAARLREELDAHNSRVAGARQGLDQARAGFRLTEWQAADAHVRLVLRYR
jgi:hypothetical protein